MINNATCYLCGSKNLKKREGEVRDNKNLDIMECQDCGLVFLSSFDHITNNFYEESNMFNNNPLNIDELTKVCKVDDDRRYKQYEELITNKEILDVGCGCGGFLLRAKNRAKSCVGVELERRFSQYYEDNSLEVYNDISQIKKSFDYIFMFHVLEHIADPFKFLNGLKPLLQAEIGGGGSFLCAKCDQCTDRSDALIYSSNKNIKSGRKNYLTER